MNVLLFTIGSHGDVHPFVGLGMAMRARGHDVTLITNPHFERLARSAGLNFGALGTDEEFHTLMHDPDLWHPTRGFDAVFLRGVLPLLEPAYQLIAERQVPGNTLLIGSSLGFAARIAHEKFGMPMATAHISPAVMRSVYDSPRLPGLPMPQWLPKWLKRWIWDGGDKYVLDPKLAPKVNEFRAEVGLTEPVSGIINEWWNSEQLILGMWPDWFGPVQPDWPKQLRLTGFPLYDEKGVTPMSDDLVSWLDAGEPPIAFTAGSAMVQGESFFKESAKACALLNRRGLLLTRHTDQIPRDLPPMVKHVDYAPFGTLLPRCAAIVHHGGIGTTSQSLASGTPQLIMPMSHDQFDNIRRVQKLGCGREIRQKKYRAPAIADELRLLLDNPQTAESCREIASRFIGTSGLETACDLLEGLFAQPTVNQEVMQD